MPLGETGEKDFKGWRRPLLDERSSRAGRLLQNFRQVGSCREVDKELIIEGVCSCSFPEDLCIDLNFLMRVRRQQ